MNDRLHFAGADVGAFRCTFGIARLYGRPLTENKVKNDGNGHTAVVGKVDPRAYPTFVTRKV